MPFKRFLSDSLASLGAVLILTLLLWAPALFQGGTIFHGDFLSVALPQFDLLARSIQGTESVLWSDGVYGGHPLFAEGQGAFADPFYLFAAGVVAPVFGTVYAVNFLLCWSTFWGGAGVAGLCRSLGASPWASGFAALAVGFSGLWLSQLQNPTIFGTLVWVPWCLWALEAWLKTASLRGAALFGTATALLVLAGYPQGGYAALLYMLASLTVEIPTLSRDRRRAVRLAASGALAMLLCLGLCAVRWLPLLELVTLSHRHDGVPLMEKAASVIYLRGFLLPGSPSAEWPVFAGLSSLLVCVTVTLLPFSALTRRVKGHVAAAALLLMIGIPGPVFELLYAHDLLPGLHFFRIVFPYIGVALIGLGVAAAVSVDGLAALLGQERLRRGAMIGLALLAMGWILAVWWIGYRLLPPLGYGVLLGVLIAAGALARFGKAALLPPAMVLALTVECLGVKIPGFPFAPASIFDRPASVQAIEQLPAWRDYKTYADGVFAIYAMRPPFAEGLQQNTRTFAADLGAMSNLLWDLPSINGALALPLQRRMLIQPVIDDEIHGTAAQAAGLRLIDLLGIRFVALTKPATNTGFAEFWHEPEVPGWILENQAARPRFQLYARHVAVDTPEQALATLQAASTPMLVIENPMHNAEMADPSDADGKAMLDIIDSRATVYRLHVLAQAPVWLFLADANYPGWHAAIDGVAAPLFTAQILGKAVAVPAGEHDIVLRFDSGSFRYGLWTTLVTLATLAAAAMASALRRRVRPAPAA
jgi:hypothetical protein